MSSSAVQWLIVGGLVAASALYAIWAILSPSARIKLIAFLERCFGANKITSRFKRRSMAALAGGCGSCASNAPPMLNSPQTPKSPQTPQLTQSSHRLGR